MIIANYGLKLIICYVFRCSSDRKCPPDSNNEVQLVETRTVDFARLLRADVSKYRPEVYKSEKSKILKKIHKVALGKLLT